MHLTSVTNSGIMDGDNTQHTTGHSREEDEILVHNVETETLELASDSVQCQFVCRDIRSTESVSSGWGQGHGFDDASA